MKQYKYYLLLFLSAVIGCKKPYNPPASSSPGSYLVVEGAIISGADSTIIKLSKTVNLSSKITNNPVLNATVTVEGDQNTSYILSGNGNGNYVSAGLNLDNLHKYRLRIKTTNDEYLSDYVAVLNSPPIDSVSFNTNGTPENAGLNILVNTHDATNNVKYYRWDFQETWIFHSDYYSVSVSNGDTVLARPQSEQVYQCWQSDTSSNIILGSTAALSKDIVTQAPITSVISTAEKLGNKYSIQVRQYALTGDAYNFYLNIKQNTENLGSIFDAQPSQIHGNIHSIMNPSEPVIGYITVGNIAVKRIFITNQQLPDWATAVAYPLYECPLDTELLVYYPPNSTTPINQENIFYNFRKPVYIGQLIPIAPLQPPEGSVIGHTGSNPLCVDCTLRGTNKQPAFWQ